MNERENILESVEPQRIWETSQLYSSAKNNGKKYNSKGPCEYWIPFINNKF